MSCAGSRATSSAALLLLPLAACGWEGPSLAGQPGLQWEVASYYGSHAVEDGFQCPNPRINGVGDVKVVEETPTNVVMDLSYYYVDDTQTIDVNGGSLSICQDWSQRRFTFARGTDGRLAVIGMSGPQKRR